VITVGPNGVVIPRAFSRFLEFLESLDYHSSYDVVEARAYGVPQHRRRLVLLASRHGCVGMPQPTHGPGRLPFLSVRDAIADLPSIDAGTSHPFIPNHVAARLSDRNLERIRATPEGGDRRQWPETLVLDCHKRNEKAFVDAYGRMTWSRPSSALTTRCISYSNGRFGHPEQDRAISVREGARLQTFPDQFVFEGTLASTARQVGNAVPVALAWTFGSHVARHLGTCDRA